MCPDRNTVLYSGRFAIRQTNPCNGSNTDKPKWARPVFSSDLLIGVPSLSYISTVEPLADMAVSARAGRPATMLQAARAPVSRTAEAVGNTLAATVFLVVMGGLSLTFCTMLASAL